MPLHVKPQFYNKKKLLRIPTPVSRILHARVTHAQIHTHTDTPKMPVIKGLPIKHAHLCCEKQQDVMFSY